MICNFFHENGTVSLILPGSLMQFNKKIKDIVTIEKARFLARQCFSIIFSKIELGHIFTNNANLKKLIVRTKVSYTHKSKRVRDNIFTHYAHL